VQVIATAGHVDHGKSALVRALTGMEPDRWAEERRRGLTIDLGFAWTKLPGGERVAFVDVPGHERFVPNMLAGLGPVPAVLFVVAADGGWMPQSAEHLAAVDAVGIRHGLLAVTRSDLADPGPAMRQALDRISRTSLGAVPAVAVSAVTGAGLADLRDALARLVAALPVPDPAAPVRLWVDRSFSIRGSGTVVTGTLPAGTVTTGQELLLTPSLRPARIRGLESMNEPVTSAAGVARVAVNLRGVPAGYAARGMALVEAGRWTLTRLLDVRLSPPESAERDPEVTLPAEITLHIGSARTQARIRPLGGSPVARLMLRDPLPLHVGDRVLLRDPGSAAVMILGATVLDVDPPALARRGAAAAAGRELASWPDPPSAADLLRRHGILRAAALTAMGVPCGLTPVAGDWLADPDRWASLRRRLAEVVAAHAKRDPLAIGMPPEAARATLGLPDRALVEALAHGQIRLEDGYLRPAGAPAVRDPVTGEKTASLPPRIAAAVRAVLADLADAPFLAPDAGRLRELGLDPRAIAAAARAGLLLRVTEQIVLAPGAQVEAARILAGLPQPFTTAEARQALGTTRRVAIPLLEYLDRSGITQRLPDDRRRLRLLPGPPARGAGQLAETHGEQEGPVVVVIQPAGVGALQPGVVEQAVRPGQPEPAGRVPEQPGSHPAAAVPGCDVQVADVGPAAVPGQPLSGVQDLRLDVADHLIAEHGGQATAVDPDRAADRQPVQRRIRVPARAGQVLDRSQVDDLGVPGVGEPGPPVERRDVRPLLRHPVHAGHRQFPAGVLARHAPAAEYTGARRYQRLRRPGRVRPEGIADRGQGPVEQPVDLAGIAERRPGPVVRIVPEQVRGGRDPAALLGHQGDALAHPGVHDELTGLAFQRAQHGVHRHAHARHHHLGVGVHELGELVAVTAAERSHLDI
jgi:selenocysteine-specific elongation factor